jgi:predicted ester cyclase
MRLLLTLATLAALTGASPTLAAQIDDRGAIAIARPQKLIVDKGLPAATVTAMLKPVGAFYGFWNNGSQKLLDTSISPRYVDHTLPKGRPQGPAGAVAASGTFLRAIPDLKIEVVQRLVVGDRVVSQLRLTGHFTGTFMGATGTGQPIDYMATDILRVSGGRITEIWHVEDNLSFQQQIGLVPAG